jgi:histone H3/H4
MDVVELTRKHTAGVGNILTDIRRSIDALVARRDERRDGFVKVIGKAVQEKLGDDAEAVMKELTKNGIPRQLAKDALAIAEQQGRFTIFALVDALTRLAGRLVNAGDRLEIDAKAAQLLTLAA